jgi:AbrB family looped-hinge helix DNA binding protein
MGSSNLKKSKVSAKGWVVIPAALRRRYRLQPGTLIEFREEGDKLVIISSKGDPVEELFGKLAGPVSLKAALLEERTAELNREETALRLG